MQVVLETTRLILRELAAEDLDFVATMLADPDVTRYYETDFSRDDSAVWLDRQIERYQSDGHGLWLATERATGEPVGQAGLVLQEVEGQQYPELGWLLHRPWWGLGYATEAAAATRDLARERWDYGRLISLIRPANKPSR